MYKARLAALAAVLVTCGTFAANPASAREVSGTTLLISVGMQTYALDPETGQLGPTIANGQDGITSPNGSKVAYVRDYDECQPEPEGGCRAARDLLTANLDGTQERPVAIGGLLRDRLCPDWSPSGKQIVFTWHEPNAGGSALAWVNADGTGYEDIVITGQVLGCGTFSPDGKKIAYQADQNIHVMDVANRKTTTLTADGSADGFSPPSWSPDGTRLAYTSSTDGKLYVMNSDGTNRVNLTDQSSDQLFRQNTPVFSPDGQQIAFSASTDPNGFPAHIYGIDAAGTNLHMISEQAGTLTGWAHK